MTKVLVCGDTEGIKQLLAHIPKFNIIGVIGASNRPQYHQKLEDISESIEVPLIIQPTFQSKHYVDFYKKIDRLEPDLILINSYSMLIREDILKIPTHGVLNIHSAPLPKYRGPNPIQWALINGDMEFGVTVHEVTNKIDAGSIIVQKKFFATIDDSWLTLKTKLEHALHEILKSNIEDFLNGNWVSAEQNESKATSSVRRTANDSEFYWHEPILTIYNKIRALVPPLPPAFVKNENGMIREFTEKLNLNNLICLKLEELGGGKLIGQKILLRPVKRNDSELLYKWINDKDLVHFNSPFKPISEIQHDEWLKKVLDERNDLIIFVIEEKDTHKVIGSCQLFNINWIHRSAELQIRIGDSNYFGRGFGVEAIETLCKFGFTELNLNRIYLNVFESNTRAIRAYEKAGFKLEGVMQEAAHIDGQFVNVHIMALLRDKLIRPVGM